MQASHVGVAKKSTPAAHFLIQLSTNVPEKAAADGSSSIHTQVTHVGYQDEVPGSDTGPGHPDYCGHLANEPAGKICFSFSFCCSTFQINQ